MAPEQNHVEDTAPPVAQLWLTVDEAAERARCSDKSIYNAAKKGKLRAAKAFNRYRFKAEWIDAWLEQSATPVEIRR
jgi:excisionase family DNA binding protein